MKSFRSELSPWEMYQAVYPLHDVSFFLDSPGSGKLNQDFSFIGFDPVKTLSVKAGAKPLEKLRAFWKSTAKKNGALFGYLGYELAQDFESVKFRKKKADFKIPDMWFGYFKNWIVYDHAKKKYFLHGKGRLPDFSLREFKFGRFELESFKPEIAKSKFLSMVRRAKEYIAAGDIYQANLSQKFHFRSRGSALALYGKLRQINPSPFSCFFKIGGLEIISSSPERLVSKHGRKAETRPIAGTCPKSFNESKLKAWRKKLLGSNKERAEHLMLVDLERNDLGRVCDFKSVKVGEFMTLEKYSHVVHLVSQVAGNLRKDKDGFDLIKAMFPGGTITGCPKVRCMEIIDELEPTRRHLYTGSIGYIDSKGDLDLNIVIRTLILQNGRGTFQVGAGIVHDSVPEKEYAETLAKGEALMQALVEASV